MGAVEEELDGRRPVGPVAARGRQPEQSHGEELLTLQPERLATRGDDHQLGQRIPQHPDEATRRGDHVFAVVEHDDARVLGEPDGCRLDGLIPEGGGDGALGRARRQVGEGSDRDRLAELLPPPDELSAPAGSCRHRPDRSG